MIERITEQPSNYRHLEHMTVTELLNHINREDKSVPLAVEKTIPQISALVEIIVEKMKAGGRLFYIGAGTSGRLGILDASECPPTYGVPFDLVIGLIAGGDVAIRRSVEHAEDDPKQAWLDLLSFGISDKDVVIGIAASGTTPYVIYGLDDCNQHGIVTGCITCNPGSPLEQRAGYPVVAVVGPEFVTGSTRMKSGTAQKLILNMISTSVMIRLGRVKDNKMVDMKMTNDKLRDRGANMIVQKLNVSYEEARELLKIYGSVREVLDAKE
ncbi:MAG: N-acetylmuramic acid 6-phosphate etherase [Saprospiraceae bacterium]|nr:N-acetylmuramic acid 6-phosphate etherase [Saprospiraceae bacterium]